MLVQNKHEVVQTSCGMWVNNSLYDIKTAHDNKDYYEQLCNAIAAVDSELFLRGDIVRLEHVVLDGMSFKSKHLLNIVAFDCIFVGCDFSEVTFTNCVFSNCDFYSCMFNDCYFNRYVVSNQSIIYADNAFFGCNFNYCAFVNALLNTCKLLHCRFDRDCNLQNAAFNPYCINVDNTVFDDKLLKKFEETVAVSPYYRQRCPEEGSFIGWKKARMKDHEEETPDRCLVKLLVPEEAKRSSGFSNKIRVSMAKVLGIYDYSTEAFTVTKLPDFITATSLFNERKDRSICYKVGEMVYSDSFDDNRWNECSHGIHLFLSKKEAMLY